MIKGASKTLYKNGFTLIEVIISLGIFGLIIGGLFSLLPWGVDNVKKLADRNIALGLVDAIHLELERLGFSVVEHGTKRLDGLYDSASAPVDISNGDIRSLVLVAPKNGNKVSLERVIEVLQPSGQKKLTNKDLADGENIDRVITDFGGSIDFLRFNDKPICLDGFEFPKDKTFTPRWVEPKDRYFAILCSQFAMQPRSDSDPTSKHFHHPSNGYLCLQIEVQWPYKIYDPSSSDFSRTVEPRFRSSISFPLAIVR